MIVIGSHAMKYWFSDFREPKDFDCITTTEEAYYWIKSLGDDVVSALPNDSGTKIQVRLVDKTFIEIELVEMVESARMIYEQVMAPGHRRTKPTTTVFRGKKFVVPRLLILFAIKASHIHQPIHWRKNIKDYHYFLTNYVGGKFHIQQDEDVYKIYIQRKKEVDERVKKRPPSLSMSNSDFFRQHKLPVETPYPHDALHWAVAYNDEPVFYKMKHDTSKAKCDKDLFDALPEFMKLHCVREETMVIALERYLIPGILTDTKEAYLRALERVSTTLTSGWFREFAINNYHKVKEPDIDYLGRFRTHIDWAVGKVNNAQ